MVRNSKSWEATGGTDGLTGSALIDHLTLTGTRTRREPQCKEDYLERAACKLVTISNGNYEMFCARSPAVFSMYRKWVID